MKITVQTTITKQVEINLPAYRKSNCHFFKVISDKLTIKVTELDSHCGIDETPFSDSAFVSDNEDSTEIEFSEAYERVLNRMNDKLKM